MGGLIPLLLPSTAGTRSSVIYDSRRSSSSLEIGSPTHAQAAHRRQNSLPALKSARRLSMASPPTLPVLPYTRTEWKRAISEVKRKYLSRKYRSCSARCCEILDNHKDTAKVEPLHLVYLHFYAASSFEMCARPLSQTSDYRTKMLRDAREHYDQATKLIQKIEDMTAEKARSASASSTSSSLHSPSMSVSSDAPTMSTSLSSPRNSVSSVEDISPKAGSEKTVKKKKVSFSGLPDESEIAKPWEQQQDPYIRPDSPTLGWEEDHFLSGSQETSYATNPALSKPVEQIPEPEVEVPKLRPSATNSNDLPPTPVEESFNLETFIQNKTKNRFYSQLSALKDQVAWHRDAIDTLISQPSDAVSDTPAVPEIPPVPALLSPALMPPSALSPMSLTSSPVGFEPTTPMSPHSGQLSPHVLEHALSDRLYESFGSASSFDLSIHPDYQSGGANEFAIPRTRSRSGSFSSSSRPPSAASTVRSTDENIRERIERLRARGWQRKRFDSRRYEALREQVLGELGAR